MRDVSANLNGVRDRDSAERAAAAVRREAEGLRRLRGELVALGPAPAPERGSAKRHSDAILGASQEALRASQAALAAVQGGGVPREVAANLLAASDDYGRAMTDFRQQFRSLFGEGEAKDAPAVVGKWQQANGGEVEFRADGSMTISSPSGPRPLKYRLADGKTIELVTPDGAPLTQWKIVSLDARELVVANLQGTQTTFRRVK
jgi:hypothetical protein